MLARLMGSVLAGLVICGCGGLEVDPDEPGADLRIAQDLIGNDAYAEGARSYFELSSDDTTLRLELDEGAVEVRLKPGTYALRSYQRACVGSCDANLASPSDECTADVELSDGDNWLVSARVALSESPPCRIRVTEVGADQ